MYTLTYMYIFFFSAISIYLYKRKHYIFNKLSKTRIKNIVIVAIEKVSISVYLYRKAAKEENLANLINFFPISICDEFQNHRKF